MQVLKRHKKIVLIAVLLVVILAVSLIIVQSTSKPSPKPTPSPAPTEISPTPTETVSSSPTPTPTQTPTSSLYPGEVTQYQGQSLTSISEFLEDLNQHPDVSIEGTQYINQTTYLLTVNGLVNNTMQYTYNDLINNFLPIQVVATLYCVEGWSVTMLWEGVPVASLLQEADVSPNATTLIFYASDGYTTSLPLSYVEQNNLILAYKLNNVTLPASAGWPLMLVAQNQWGYKWIKWVTSINVSNDSSYLGYWESRGYPNNATITGNPNDEITFSDYVSVAEVIVVFVAVVIVAAAMLRIYKRSTIKAKN